MENKKTMISESDYQAAETLEGILYDLQLGNKQKQKPNFSRLAELVARMRENLKIAPLSFLPLSKEDKQDNYFVAECDGCGWWGSSKLMTGGGAIADTGDHFDCTCPVCGMPDPDEKSNN